MGSMNFIKATLLAAGTGEGRSFRLRKERRTKAASFAFLSLNELTNWACDDDEGMAKGSSK
jgi:hypothetical protein